MILARIVRIPALERTNLESSHWFVDFSVVKQRLASSSRQASAPEGLLQISILDFFSFWILVTNWILIAETDDKTPQVCMSSLYIAVNGSK